MTYNSTLMRALRRVGLHPTSGRDGTGGCRHERRPTTYVTGRESDGTVWYIDLIREIDGWHGGPGADATGIYTSTTPQRRYRVSVDRKRGWANRVAEQLATILHDHRPPN